MAKGLGELIAAAALAERYTVPPPPPPPPPSLSVSIRGLWETVRLVSRWGRPFGGWYGEAG